MRRFILAIAFIISFSTVFAQEKETYLYATKDTSKLYMDVYVPQVQNEQQSCLIFVFGGGFVGGKRNDSQIQQIKKHFTDKGFVVIAIDYRLGMRGQKKISAVASVKQFEKAINMAAEDLISAIDYTLKNLLDTKKYKINPTNIILMGSSAGAITVLETDYALCNGYLNSNILPADFRPAGVISYAGAIFSTHGKPKYKNHEPAPTLLCHGTIDKLVYYNKLQVFNFGLFGSSSLAKQFKKNGYSYYIRRYPDLGHQVAIRYNDEFDFLDRFITDFVFTHKNLQIDEIFHDPTIEPKWTNLRIRDLEKAS